MTRVLPRKIIHMDLDAFFCAVEELHDPSLVGKPFAVGGRPEGRGVVASCSYAARVYGVHSAMPTAQALRLCPGLIVIPGRHHEYTAYSRRVMQHLSNLTDAVEQISIDEAFIDVTDLKAPAREIAETLQRTLWDELHLPCSLGVASNKLVAKIANTVGKATAEPGRPPMAITVVPPGQEAAFLAPLPVVELWGVGPKTAQRLEALGVKSIGDLATWPEGDLVQRFGTYGHDLIRRAQGIDTRSVASEHRIKSMGRETTFVRDVTDEMTLRRVLCQLVEDVGQRLRRAGRAGNTVKLKLRWADFTTITRQITLEEPTAYDDVILQAAEGLLRAHWPKGRAVRLIGVAVSNLGPPAMQLRLWDKSYEKQQRLQAALDHVRERFGRDAIRRAIVINDKA